MHVFDNCVDELKVDFLNVFKMIETVAPLRGIYDPWLVGTSGAIDLVAHGRCSVLASAVCLGQRRSLQHGRRHLVDALDDDLTAAIRGLQGLIGELHAAKC